MRYQQIEEGIFKARPNRFIAHVETGGREEICHVKNTGRCRELLVPGASVFLEKSSNPNRKTKYDLIAVKKGERLINMDSQIPNAAAEEWLKESRFFGRDAKIRREVTYGNSRFDLYIETGKRKIFMEVKGVTLEEDGVVRFPDAPTQRGVKHIRELCRCIEDGYEAYIMFVIQMEDVKYFEPNDAAQPEFREALKEAENKGVKIFAYTCTVRKDLIKLAKPVRVYLDREKGAYMLEQTVEPLLLWYRENKRELPWRQDPTPYHVWISEIMLQQTRVEAVKEYYARFIQQLPDIPALAGCQEEKLLKLWEGLGYYNRVKNMQKAAKEVMEKYGGQLPADYQKLLSLPGIGSYTAGAVASIAYGIPEPAVDGNVFRVLARITEDEDDILKQSTRKKIEGMLRMIMPSDTPGEFNQALMELGATVCVPNGAPRCESCPLAHLCGAHERGTELQYPKKAEKKQRRIEERTVLVIQNGQEFAICRRPPKGLLAGLYELPNTEGYASREEVLEYIESLGLLPLHIKDAGEAKHIFSHVEWHMKGYFVKVASTEEKEKGKLIFVDKKESKGKYPIPSAFAAYRKYIEEDF